MSKSTILSTPTAIGATRMMALMLLWAEDAGHTFLQYLRTTHYPPNLTFRNTVHISVFTRLAVPSSRLELIQRTLRMTCAKRKPFSFMIGPLCQWEKTVVMVVDSHKLGGLRKDLTERYALEYSPTYGLFFLVITLGLYAGGCVRPGGSHSVLFRLGVTNRRGAHHTALTSHCMDASRRRKRKNIIIGSLPSYPGTKVGFRVRRFGIAS
ncbi:hypothetical protein BGW80DRAFT_1302794 [Lactifluus volemus]|nr:hypothetical protein BGW80DRAFT_1302794 [Lactifluus volemus]